MDPTLVFLRAEVSFVILKALFDAILADEVCVLVFDGCRYETDIVQGVMVLKDECVCYSMANWERTLRVHAFSEGVCQSTNNLWRENQSVDGFTELLSECVRSCCRAMLDRSEPRRDM